MRKFIFIFTLVLFFTTVACESTLDNKEVILTENNLNGQWIVTAYSDDVTFGPFTIQTQMSYDNDSIFIKDGGEFWNFQTKVLVSPKDNIFETTSSINEVSKIGANVKVQNGALINNDSISFNIQFEDDETPFGYTYQIKGHRK